MSLVIPTEAERCRQPRVIRQNFQSDPTATTPQASRNHDEFGIQRETGELIVLRSAGGLALGPEVRQFVIVQLLVIIVPVGLMFALWVSLLNKKVQR